MVQGRALLQIASDQFQCSRVMVPGGSGKERYTTFIIAGIFLVCIVQLSAAAGSPKTTAKIIPLKEEPEMEWDDCKFHIDSLQSWQDEQLCQNRSSIDSRPDTCDNCFDPTVLLAINTPTLCDKEQKPGIIDVLFIISSLHQHFRLRTRIRNNWGSVTANNTTNFRHVFLLGTSPNADVMSKVRQEARLFGDMLVGHFNDHYYNLTFKTMMGVNWAVKNCGHARFFVKMDDDVWVNTNRLLVKLQENTLYLQEAIGGMCFVKALVKRDKTSKWYVPEAYYANEFYSQYCYGFAYVGAMAVLEQVLAISRHVPFFFVDDVYVGMCLEQVGFGVIKFPGFKASGDTCKDRNIDDIAVHGALHWRVVPYCGHKPPPHRTPTPYDASETEPFHKFKPLYRSRSYKPFSEYKSGPSEDKVRLPYKSKPSQSEPLVVSNTSDSKASSRSKPSSQSKTSSQSKRSFDSKPSFQYKTSSQSKPSSGSKPSSQSKSSFQTIASSQSKPSSQLKASSHSTLFDNSKPSRQATSPSKSSEVSTTHSTPLPTSKSSSLTKHVRKPGAPSEYASPETTPVPESKLLSELKPSLPSTSHESRSLYKYKSDNRSQFSEADIFFDYLIIPSFLFIVFAVLVGFRHLKIFIYCLKKLWLIITKIII